jgi:electron transfer flavoprotein-quinone oxidoreductase
VSARGLAPYRRALQDSFVLADHKRLRRAPGFLLGERVQQRYPGLVCDLAEGLFTVDNPRPKPGVVKLVREAAERRGVKLRSLLRDGLRAGRIFR